MTQTPPISAEQVEAAAEAMWRAEVADLGAARRAREAEYWADQNEDGKSKWRRLALAALNAASIPASRGAEMDGVPVAWPRIKSWTGSHGSAEGDEIPLGMARCLEGYADIKPTEGRLLWSMRAAAKWMRDVVALGPLYTALSAPQPVEEQEEIERLKTLNANLVMQAQGHATEARTANGTIYEIYQALSGATGEPGNWHGAEPAREYVARSEKRIAELGAALKPFATAWQTSYTGDQWHFDRKVSFAPADIERGIVRNITPLAALVKP